MPSSSLFLRSSTTLLSALSLFSFAFAAPRPLSPRDSSPTYNIFKTYQGSNFFQQFSFYSGADPTDGYVTYGDYDYAVNNQLIDFEDGAAIMRVDSSSYLTQTSDYAGVNGVGRKSVRVEGVDTFQHGLVVADIAHMPSGICGTWPAFWTLGGPDGWPYAGEIDIIEGANNQAGNWMSLHTGHAASIADDNNPMSGSIAATDCNVETDPNNPNYTGCKVVDSDPSTFSDYNGGVWAMQWTSDVISVWFWPYGSVPSSALSNTPVVTSDWGVPRSSFGPSGGMNIDNNFKNQHIIFDTTFCGSLGDAVWGSTSQPGTCAYLTGVSSCATYVAQNPSAFSDAYWKVNYVKIFTEGSATSSTTTSTTTTSSTTTSSSSTTTTTTSSSSSSSSSSATTTSASTTASSTTTSSSSITTTSSPSSSATTTSASTTASSTTTSSSSSSITTTSSSSSATTTSKSTTASSTTISSTTSTSSKADTSSSASTTTSSTVPTTSSKTSTTSSIATTSSSVVTTTSSWTTTSTVSFSFSTTLTTKSSSTSTTSAAGSSSTTYTTFASISSSSTSSTWTSSSVSQLPTSTTTSNKGKFTTSSTSWEPWTSSSTTTSFVQWEQISSTTTKSTDPTWSQWKSTTAASSLDPVWEPVPSGDGYATTHSSKSWSAYTKGGDEWVTKTITDIYTVPCTTATGYETKTTVYVTVVPAHPDAASTWAALTGAEPAETATATGTWEPIGSKPVAESSSASESWTAWSTVGAVTTYPVVSITVHPVPVSTATPVSADSWSSWASASVPAASASVTTTWSSYNGSIEGVKVYKGAASSIVAQGNVMLAVALAGVAFFLL